MIEMICTSTTPPKPSEPVYERFLAYMDSLALQTLPISSSNLPSGKRKINLGSGVMNNTLQGTPWGSNTSLNSNAGRIIQHCCPSQEVFERLIAEARFVMLESSRSSSSIATAGTALTRNGFSSSSTTFPRDTVFLRYTSSQALVYYDSTTQMMYAMGPMDKTGPVPWTIPNF